MQTGIYIQVNGKAVDIGDPELDIVVLTEWVERMIPITKTRLVMTLLKRREEFDEYILHD
jgi:hypothetical protein